MAAVYPGQYTPWLVHKDISDTVYAVHVNNLQDEVAALQQTMGLTPHLDKTGIKMQKTAWASVADRLDGVQRGQGVPAIYLSKSTDSFKNIGSGTAHKNISFAAPSRDPERLFNGHSVTANRSGWWQVFARSIWTSATGALITGDRELALMINNSAVMTQDANPSSDGNTHMHIGWQGWVTAGNTIDLGVLHSVSGKTLSLGSLHLSAAMLREI
jgi:hypothetical protein